MGNYRKLNRVAFEEKIRNGEYATALGASRAVGKAEELSSEDRVQLKTLIKTHFVGTKTKAYRKIERRLSGKKRYVSFSYAQRAITRAVGLTKTERQELMAAAKTAFEKKTVAAKPPQSEAVARKLSKVHFKKRPFFEIFNETMSNKQHRDLISEFCLSALEAEGDGVSLPTIVEAIKRAKSG